MQAAALCRLWRIFCAETSWMNLASWLLGQLNRLILAWVTSRPSTRIAVAPWVGALLLSKGSSVLDATCHSKLKGVPDSLTVTVRAPIIIIMPAGPMPFGMHGC